jgi:hypothetical protein
MCEGAVSLGVGVCGDPPSPRLLLRPLRCSDGARFRGDLRHLVVLSTYALAARGCCRASRTWALLTSFSLMGVWGGHEDRRHETRTHPRREKDGPPPFIRQRMGKSTRANHQRLLPEPVTSSQQDHDLAITVEAFARLIGHEPRVRAVTDEYPQRTLRAGDMVPAELKDELVEEAQRLEEAGASLLDFTNISTTRSLTGSGSALTVTSASGTGDGSGSALVPSSDGHSCRGVLTGTRSHGAAWTAGSLPRIRVPTVITTFGS